MRRSWNKGMEQQFLLTEYGKQKLIGYADSFLEIARTLDVKREIESNEEKQENTGSRQSCFLNRKLTENRCMLAENLTEMSAVMTMVAGEVFSYRQFSERKTKQVISTLKMEQIDAGNLYYVENKDNRMKISIILSSYHPGGISTWHAADILSVLLDTRLVPCMNCPEIIDDTLRGYLFIEEAGYVILTGAARASKENESQSGDNYSVLESEKGKITLMLSDGMGSGEGAAKDSEMVLNLMEKLIEAGFTPKAAAKMVNSTLVTRGEEQNMSTLDICEIDLYNGICEFTKVGAAASYIKRGYLAEQIQNNTLPLGILKGMNDNSITKRLLDGDYIIMVTDGVVDVVENSDYPEDMCSIISDIKQENPRDIAETLLQIVIKLAKGHIQDDMTILVLGIWQNK